MSNDTDDTEESEYRPKDYLATCRLSYGHAAHEEQAIMAALRYAGPFEDADEPVTVNVWCLYADSWQKHGPTGPERGAEQIEYTEYEIDPDDADSVADHASEANFALDGALGDAEVVEHVADDEETEGD